MISTNSQKEVWEKLNSIERRLTALSQQTPPGDAQYVLMALDAALTNERVLTAGEGLSLADGGAGGNATLALDIDSLVEQIGASGDFFVYYDSVAGDHKKIDWDDMPGGGAGYWTQVGVDIYYDDGGSVIVGTVAKSGFMTEGITIFQGSSDDEILAFQSSDVNHGMTVWADTDTFFMARKLDAARGGTWIGSFISSGEAQALTMGGSSPTVNTTKTTAGAGATVNVWAGKISGTSITNIDATANIFRIFTYIGGGWYSKFWVDANGDTYQSGDIFTGDRGNNQTPQQTIRRRDSNNIWIGENGGVAWTTGDRNYSLGDYALDAINSGGDNIGIGYNALTACTGGISNIAIGSYALEALQSQNNCIAIGYEALHAHNSGLGAIAIGKFAAKADASVPQYNIYIGFESGQTSAALGANQIAIGYHALQNCSGAENVAVGYNVCSSAMSGASNVVIGSQAGTLLSSGAQNVILGADAGDNFTTGSDNVAVGYQAGDGTSTGSQNVFIGSQADGNAVAARTNAIGIGYNVSVDADNKCIIGNSSQTALQTYGDISTSKGASCRFNISDTVDGTGFPGVSVGHTDKTWLMYVAGANDFLAFHDGAANVFELWPGGAVLMIGMKSGATQAAAGAAANELWKTSGHATLPDNVVMIGA